MMKILWLSPSFNHYKARLLNHFAKDEEITLTILAGSGRRNQGDKEISGDNQFFLHKIDVLKKDFGSSRKVRIYIKKHCKEFDWILIPAEKKNLPLFLYLLRIRKSFGFKLFSYNHLHLKSKNNKLTLLDKQLTKFFYSRLDAVIFYTKATCNKAIDEGWIQKNKAFWANNTLDTNEIKKYYSFVLPPNELSILFIGRLIPSKQIGFFLNYISHLQKIIDKQIKIDIIGDGPERHLVQEAVKTNDNMAWHGALVDEAAISPIMTRTTLVFVPGLSGLSVNHALSYGRPYLTLESDRHGPEISYIRKQENGFIVSKNFSELDKILIPFLSNRDQIEAFCKKANEDGQQITADSWVRQIKSSLKS